MFNTAETQSKYDLSFREELAKLNTAQKVAVEHLEGPVLVIAGPGTGKTQILSARIGKILSSPDIQAAPHNILCLTYTDSGTVAMRKRLLQFIGPEAYRVHIYTFHAFCNQVIQDNLDYFGFRELQPISDLESLDLFQNLVDSFGPKHPLKRFSGEVYYETSRLKELFAIMKKESWDANFISEKIDEYLTDLPNREDFQYKKANKAKGINTGDINQRLFNIEKESMELLRAASAEFPAYQKLMEQLKRYDYNDMILWVLNAFKKNHNILLPYQERYQYFLVDEYQDTNGAQNEILNMLTSYWDEPNVFVVGDDDQSIYRFQGANVKNIVDFNELHKASVKIIVMTENYRSTQQILDASKAVIDNNNERLVQKIDGLNKQLIAKGKTDEEFYQSVKVVEYFNTLHEEAGIAKEIEKLWLQGEDLSEVAVIYRNHRIVENIVKIFEKKNIPLNIKQKINILDLPFIGCIINLLKYIQQEYDRPDSSEFLLYELMHYCFYNISGRDAAVIARECQPKENIGRKSWRELIADKKKLSHLNLESLKAICELESNLIYYIKELPNLTLQGLFEKILTRGGILTYVMNSPDKIWLMQVVSTFFDFIKDESAKKSQLSLKEFLRIVEQMQSNGIKINLNKIIHAENGVNFVTAHSSKGLEFKHVFLISTTSQGWEKKRGMHNTYRFPDTLTETNIADKAEEERRLFYVGLTRAKSHLHISYHAQENNGRELEMSQFVAEILDKMPIEVARVSLPDEDIILFQAELMMGAEKPKIGLIDHDFLKDALKNYKMSVTHLNKFLQCPLSFYFENIIRVPTARSESMGFGNAIHFALQQLFQNMIGGKDKIFLDHEKFYNFFERGMKNYHSHFTEKEMERRLEFGRELLPDFLGRYRNEWAKDVVVEYKVGNAEFEGVPITGALDKIEIDGSKVNVVDYKTGNPDTGRKNLNPPNDKDPLGGDYWRQIVFYKILLESDKTKNWEMVSGEIDFVQKNEKKEFSKHKLYVTPEHLEIVKDQIKDTYKKIMNFEFDKGCGEDDCQWCNFVKTHYKAEELTLIQKEEE